MELLGKNLFQDPEEDDEGNVKYCKMHDLVHDLAEGIAGEEIKQLVEPLYQVSSTDELMHVSVNMIRPEYCRLEFKAPATLLSATKIRSLLIKSNHFFNYLEVSSLEMMVLKFQSLRALDLENMNIYVVPNSIRKLRHLRYLNLAWNRRIKCLPDGITRLQNLQTLNLKACFRLKKLPRDFCELDNLRHLAIYKTSLTEFPSGLGKMTSLIDLDYIIVGKNYGTYSLPPCPPMVICIRVDSYKGVEMPRRWLDGLSNLFSICIMKCDECKVLPQLSHLEDLTLEEIDGLEYVEDEDWVCGGDADGGGKCGSGAHNVYFPSLKELELELKKIEVSKGVDKTIKR
ncbi:putative disease resistance protein RGA1 [Chenopodium quinoa]|uniref:putative disease resistance protein RGA1 n=1 Tax=Chenopodium quinoa TaxID=63459 RepID=UPI000B7784C8|nr:putative disease resistance protein RGA1 [Chenopodium quinoa]